jgi:hypothetical protein
MSLPSGPTGAQINWGSVEYGTHPIKRVTSGGFSLGGQLIRFNGDTDRYTSIIANVNNEPSATFTTADVGSLMTIPTAGSATLAATLLDALAATGGDVIFSLVNAVYETADAQAQHAQFGTVTASWQGYASDGQTNPLSISRA